MSDFLSPVSADVIMMGDSLTVKINGRSYGIVVIGITPPLNNGARLVTGLQVGLKTRKPSQRNGYKSFWTDEAIVQRFDIDAWSAA